MTHYWVVVQLEENTQRSSNWTAPVMVHGFFNSELQAEHWGETQFKDDYEVVPFQLLVK